MRKELAILAAVALAVLAVIYVIGSERFKELLGEAECPHCKPIRHRSAYRVTYEVVYFSEGREERGRAVIAVSGGRVKVVYDLAGAEVAVYLLEEGSYTCIKREGAWHCTSGKRPPVPMPLPEEVNPKSSNYLGTMEVAGEVTYCFREARSSTETTVCFTGDGIPAYMESRTMRDGKLASSIALKAISIERTVSEEEFKLPVKP